jgi:hypothetical protein
MPKVKNNEKHFLKRFSEIAHLRNYAVPIRQAKSSRQRVRRNNASKTLKPHHVNARPTTVIALQLKIHLETVLKP